MNTFVQPYVKGQQAQVICPLYDPREVRSNRARFRRDTIHKLDLANSIFVPSGRWSAKGWILLLRSDYNKLSLYNNTFQLNIGDPTAANNVATLTNLSIVQARCVTRGLASDVNALYLVDITDDRGILHNDWFQAPITTAYNIRAKSYPQLFYSSTMNGGSAWTWSTMLQDMWNKLNVIGGGSVLGNWPGLPFTPVGTPEGWWFNGVPGWYALNDVLELVGMTIACDLTKANPYTIINAGGTDAAFTALQSKYITNLEDDREWIDVGAGRVPATIYVLFRRRNQYYGTEETVRRDGYQWLSIPYYSVTISAPALFSNAIGVHFLWDDFTVEYDIDGAPLPADTATAATIAAERVTQYFSKIYRQTTGYMSQTYAGALPFTTGPQVDGVRWYQNYYDKVRQGWKTDIVRGFFPSKLEYGRVDR